MSIKRLLLVSVLAAVAAFAAASVASAHEGAASITCTGVAYSFGLFPVGSAVIHEQVKIDGQVVATNDFTLVVTTFSSNEGGNTIPIVVPPGTHTVEADASWTVDGGGHDGFPVTKTLAGCTTASPSLSSTASGPVSVSAAIHDTAHLSGGLNPTGAISFDVFDATCTSKLATVAALTVVNGAGDYPSANYIPAAAGAYKWVAHYSGDANNAKADTVCGDAGETSVVTTTPSIATTLSASAVTTGTAVHDSATLTGATTTAGGTVTYTVYTNSLCTAGAQSAGTKQVANGVVPDSNAIVFGGAGDFFWQAVYSGDTNNGAATSTCTSEHLVVTAAPSPPGGGGSSPTETLSTPQTPTPATAPATTPTNTTAAVPTPAATTEKPRTSATPAAKPKAKPKPKPKLFKPPKVKTKARALPPPCYTITVGPKDLATGKPDTLRVRVTAKNKPIVGTKVSVKGSGIQIVTKPTNSAGQVTLVVRPRKPGLISLRAASQKSCNTARVGVVGSFTPPVTG